MHSRLATNLRKTCYCFLLLVSASYLSAQDRCLDRIEVKAVSFQLETFYSVSCSTFEKSFKTETKARIISNQDTVLAFCKAIKTTKKANKKFDVDVRAKLCLHYVNAPYRTLCLDKFDNIILDGDLIKKNKKLIKLVKACLP
ncbi:MAG: hypothetical protein H0X41_10255 [Chitinophagaceae bacterium]|nr:hypothetical protein [Chitinophagaceae bacterium]